MIGKISGRIDMRGEDYVLIDVRGVGYIVFCSERVLAGLPGPGEAVALYTDLVVREDLMQLYGFPTLAEKEWHRLLLSVQGVGAKASLAILGTLGQEVLGRAIALGDWGTIKAAKGIGPKTAQRIVNELKDKAPRIMALGGGAPAAPDMVIEDMPAPAPAAQSAPAAPQPDAAQAQADALSALTNLGYAPAEAASAVAQAAGSDPGAESAALIRAALRLLAPKG